MGMATVTETELERELRHLHDLVFVRDLLRAHGASADELGVCDAAIREERSHLAGLAKRSAGRYAAA